jgi:hypothetical protein
LHESPARERVRLALLVDSFDADSVRVHCMAWLLDPFSFLQGCSRSWRVALLLPPLFSWLELLWRTTCLRARVCLLWSSCVALCLLLRCRLCLVLLGVAHFRSAPLGMLKPKPRRRRAWSPIWVFSFLMTCFATGTTLHSQQPLSPSETSPLLWSLRAGSAKRPSNPCTWLLNESLALARTRPARVRVVDVVFPRDQLCSCELHHGNGLMHAKSAEQASTSRRGPRRI